jgi:hypothetical protein
MTDTVAMVEIMKKYSKRIVLALAILVLVAGYYAYTTYMDRQWAHDDVVDTFEEKIPFQCESGDWTEFPDLKDPGRYEKFAGNVKLKFDENKEIFTDTEGVRIFSTDPDYSLTFFMDRDSRVEGYNLGQGNEMYVRRIKCTGEESNKDIQDKRQKLMKYISENINTLALEKAPKRNWQVETYYFANDTDLYVQYESPESFMEEGPYDSHLWLVRASRLERNVPVIETLAYIQEDAEASEKNIVLQGTDLYKDTENMTAYEFDEDLNRWVLQ